MANGPLTDLERQLLAELLRRASASSGSLPAGIPQSTPGPPPIIPSPPIPPPPRGTRLVAKLLKLCGGGLWVVGGMIVQKALDLLYQTPPPIDPSVVKDLGWAAAVLFLFGVVLWLVSESLHEDDGGKK